MFSYLKSIPLRLVNYYSGPLNKFTIEYWQNYIFYLLALAGAVAGAFCVIFTAVYLLSAGKVVAVVITIIFYVINDLMMFSKRFTLKTKVITVSFVFYLFGIGSLIIGGPVGESGIWFACSALLCSMFVGFRISFLMACLNLLTGVTVAFLYREGLIGWYFLKGFHFSSWMIQCANIFFMTVSFITSNTVLIKGVAYTFKILNKSKEATIIGLAKLAEYRDLDTGKHLDRIREYALIMAKTLSKIKPYQKFIDSQYIHDLSISSTLHDIGKVGLPDAILMKPDTLTEMEFDLIKSHTVYGRTVIQEISNHLEDKSAFNMAEDIAYCHHERWDGSGYPEGLSGTDIPLSARIVALADVYDAVTSERVYKKASSHEEAVNIITSERGKYFDPEIVEVFLNVQNRFKEVQSSYI